jgi:hypothetical protein
MISKSVYDLINREIDGKTTAEESQQLRTIIESDGEVREAFEGLKQMSQEIGDMKAIAPPPSLKASIMRSIESGYQGSVVRPRRNAANVWRFALAFCGGIAAGLLIFIVFTSTENTSLVSDAELTGTIAQQGFPLGLRPGEKLDIKDPSLTGGIESRWGKGLCLLRLDLKASENTTVKLHFDPSAVRVAAVRPSDESRTSLFFREGQVIITGRIDAPLDLVFSARNGGSPSATITIEAGGRSVISSNLKLQSIDP